MNKELKLLTGLEGVIAEDGAIITNCNGRKDGMREKYCRHAMFYETIECPYIQGFDGFCKAGIDEVEVRLYDRRKLEF